MNFGQKYLTCSILYICVIFLSPIVASDEENTYYPYEPNEYPNLITTPKSCTGPMRNPPTSVCDPENLLNKHEAKMLDKLISQNSNETYCFCQPCPPNMNGLKIKIAIVQTFKQQPNQTIAKSLADFAEYIRSTWNVSPNCNNDIIIFVSTLYNKIHISRGQKAAKVLSTSIISRLIEDTTKLLSYGELSKCLEIMVESINKETRSYDPRLDKLKIDFGFFLIILSGAASLILLAVIAYVFYKRDARNREERREKIKQTYRTNCKNQKEQIKDNFEVLIETDNHFST